MKLEFFDRFSKNTQVSNFIKILPMGAELFHADGRIDMTRLLVAFRNFANASKRVTVKFTLEQAMKDQRRSRGIASLFR
jgi:hypothetical protein